MSVYVCVCKSRALSVASNIRRQVSGLLLSPPIVMLTYCKNIRKKILFCEFYYLPLTLAVTPVTVTFTVDISCRKTPTACVSWSYST